jgi:putative oxidoreductase
VGQIASKGLPLPQVGAIIAILVEFGGGILLAIGLKARWAALAIAIFTMAAGILFHNYWAVEEAANACRRSISGRTWRSPVAR